MLTYPTSLESSKDGIFIFSGQAGCQIGTALWALFNQEHGVCADGAPVIPPTIGSYPYIDFYQDSIFYHNDPFHRKFCYDLNEKTEKYVPKALLVDLEPMVIDEIKTGAYRQLFHPERNFFQYSLKGDGASIFSRAYNSIGRLVIGDLMNSVRHLVERCNNLSVFNFIRAYGGGTGAGLGSLILEEVHDRYGKVHICENNIFNSVTNNCPTMEPYNTLLGLESSCMTSSLTMLYANRSMEQLMSNNLRIKQPCFGDINHLISQAVSGILATERFPGFGCCNIDSILTNLIPYPRIQFAFTSMSPLIPVDIQRYELAKTPLQLIDKCLHHRSNMLGVDLQVGSFISNCMVYRGVINPSDILTGQNAAINSHRINFVDWSPAGIKVAHSPLAMVQVPHSNIGLAPLGLLMLANHTNITEALSHVSFSAYMLFKKKAFMHWFVQHGLEEEDFANALENMILLSLDYKEVDHNARLHEELLSYTKKGAKAQTAVEADLESKLKPVSQLLIEDNRTNSGVGSSDLAFTLPQKEAVRRPLPDKVQFFITSQMKQYLNNKRNIPNLKAYDSIETIDNIDEFQVKYQNRKFREAQVKKMTGKFVQAKEKKTNNIPSAYFVDDKGEKIPMELVKFPPGIFAKHIKLDNKQPELKFYTPDNKELSSDLRMVISKNSENIYELNFCHENGEIFKLNCPSRKSKRRDLSKISVISNKAFRQVSLLFNDSIMKENKLYNLNDLMDSENKFLETKKSPEKPKYYTNKIISNGNENPNTDYLQSKDTSKVTPAMSMKFNNIANKPQMKDDTSNVSELSDFEPELILDKSMNNACYELYTCYNNMPLSYNSQLVGYSNLQNRDRNNSHQPFIHSMNTESFNLSFNSGFLDPTLYSEDNGTQDNDSLTFSGVSMLPDSFNIQSSKHMDLFDKYNIVKTAIQAIKNENLDDINIKVDTEGLYRINQDKKSAVISERSDRKHEHVKKLEEMLAQVAKENPDKIDQIYEFIDSESPEKMKQIYSAIAKENPKQIEEMYSLMRKENPKSTKEMYSVVAQQDPNRIVHLYHAMMAENNPRNIPEIHSEILKEDPHEFEKIYSELNKNEPMTITEMHKLIETNDAKDIKEVYSRIFKENPKKLEDIYTSLTKTEADKIESFNSKKIKEPQKNLEEIYSVILKEDPHKLKKIYSELNKNELLKITEMHKLIETNNAKDIKDVYSRIAIENPKKLEDIHTSLTKVEANEIKSFDSIETEESQKNLKEMYDFIAKVNPNKIEDMYASVVKQNPYKFQEMNTMYMKQNPHTIEEMNVSIVKANLDKIEQIVSLIAKDPLSNFNQDELTDYEVIERQKSKILEWKHTSKTTRSHLYFKLRLNDDTKTMTDTSTRSQNQWYLLNEDTVSQLLSERTETIKSTGTKRSYKSSTTKSSEPFPGLIEGFRRHHDASMESAANSRNGASLSSFYTHSESVVRNISPKLVNAMEQLTDENFRHIITPLDRFSSRTSIITFTSETASQKTFSKSFH